jgi:aminocarboxymuconate-semialdehyde decarboxylase
VRIDVHNHALPEAALRLIARDDTYGTLSGRRWRGSAHAEFEVVDSFMDPAAKLAELERKGLEAAVVSIAPPLFSYHVDGQAGEAMARATNEGLAEMCAAAPDRLCWLATAPLQDPARAVTVLEDAARAGCRGVEVGTSVAGRRLDHDGFEPFWAAAERLALPVTLHPAYVEPNAALEDYYLVNVIGFPLETTVAIERLICAGVIDRHPRLELVLVHAGGYFPYQAGRLRHARSVRPELALSPPDPWAALDRLWFDVITHDDAALRFLIDRVGADRVVMGSDLPFDMAPAEPMAALTRVADAATARRIAEDNASALYGVG